ncbi:MAG: SLC13 family permease [Nitrososphaeria archaeon]|nr:SLC13 family permease [Conexivisphaerales archaeon]
MYFYKIVPVIILIIVYSLIIKRRILNHNIEIWAAMGIGALLMLITGSITPLDALYSINIHVIAYLFGMLIIGAALYESGLLGYLFKSLFIKENKFTSIFFKLFLLIGIASSVLMNDTLAVIMTPLMVDLSKRLKIDEKFLLLLLAFGVTVGSVMTPIGNPQNLIIGLQMTDPFYYFGKYLVLPTLINLVLTFYLLKVFFYKNANFDVEIKDLEYSIKDKTLASLSKVSLVLLIIMSLLNVLLYVLLKVTFSLGLIALLSAVPVLFTKNVKKVIKRFDWKTIAFFIFMFIVMQGVFNSGFFQSFILSFLQTPFEIMFASIILSQFLSNVPFVDLFIKFVSHTPVNLVTLAAGSTIAGNFLLLGAASNIIIIQTAEAQGGKGLSFMDFAKYGTIITIINALVYLLFIYLYL